MTTLTTSVGVTPERRSVASLAEPRKARPIMIWATFGALWAAVLIYIIAAWILQGHAVTTPAGPDKAPTWMEITVKVYEYALNPAFFLAFLYFCLIRPWRREGHITLDGIFCLVFLTLYVQDPWLNYAQSWASYNALFHNWGAWTSDVPGALSSTAHLMPEPVLWAGTAYAYLMYLGVVLCCAVMRKAKAHWPRLGTLGLMGVGLGFCLVFDFIVEPITFLRLGFWSYPGAIKGLTLYYGHYYQFPVYEGVFVSVLWAGWSFLRFFQNDKGQTFVERGVDTLKVTPRQKTWVRFFAIFAGCHALFLFAYNVPVALFALHSDPFPKDYEHRSYLTDGYCGTGTQYACPGNDIPIPRGKSAHVGPDGQLVPARR